MNTLFPSHEACREKACPKSYDLQPKSVFSLKPAVPGGLHEKSWFTGQQQTVELCHISESKTSGPGDEVAGTFL